MYIVYSPEHNYTAPSGKVFAISARALYGFKDKSMPSRRYRTNFPSLNKKMRLIKCKTVEDAISERDALKEYCGEEFEIWEYTKGVLGNKLEL